jgi:ABC-type glycerol-3-phosphate transport system substrate-binding protein
MVLTVVTACTTGQSAGGPVTISFLNPHPHAYDAVIADFEKRNPDIKVEQQSVPFDAMVSQTQARLSSGDSSIDLVSVDPPRLAGMVAQGFLTDESAALPTMKSKISDVGVKSVTVGDRVWSYPLWTSDAFLFYNRDALAKAGVALPGPEDKDRVTWEQVIEDSRKVVQSGAARYGLGVDQIDRYYSLQPVLMSMGAGTGLQGPDNLTAAVNAPQWKRFGQWYADLHNDKLAPRGVEPEQMPDLFGSGQVAFYLSGPGSIAQIADSTIAGHWGIAPMPHFAAGPIVTPTDSWAVGISALSKKKDAARRLAQFMTLDPTGVVESSQVQNLPPVNKAAMPPYLDYLHKIAPAETRSIGALLDVDLAKYAEHRPISVGYVQFENTMNKAFADIRNGGDVTAILDDAQNTLIRQLSRQRELAGDH